MQLDLFNEDTPLEEVEDILKKNEDAPEVQALREAIKAVTSDLHEQTELIKEMLREAIERTKHG